MIFRVVIDKLDLWFMGEKGIWKLFQFKYQKVRSFTFRGRIASQNFVHQLFSIDSRCLSLLRSVLNLSSSCCKVRLSLDDRGRPSLHWLQTECKRSRVTKSRKQTWQLLKLFTTTPKNLYCIIHACLIFMNIKRMKTEVTSCNKRNSC